jgi:hypothetical protein
LDDRKTMIVKPGEIRTWGKNRMTQEAIAAVNRHEKRAASTP